jgi:rhodanese-related sulfurtransferase
MPIKDIDAKTLKNWLENGEAVLVDVREPFEHATGIIPEAVLLPLTFVSTDSIPDPAGKKLVFQCRSGHRSQTACEMLVAQTPYLEVYNLTGGIQQWIAEGNPVK